VFKEHRVLKALREQVVSKVRREHKVLQVVREMLVLLE
jgi:hypothetical protein